MKQKIVIKVQMNCDKCRSKAMELSAAAGVESIALEGENKDHLVLIGDGVDATGLTTILRKKFGRANIIEIEEVKKQTGNQPEAKAPSPQNPDFKTPFFLEPSYRPPVEFVVYENESTCSIM